MLAGFLSEDHDKAYGRPVGVTVTREGTLLVADDVGNTIWHVTAGRSDKDSPSRKRRPAQCRAPARQSRSNLAARHADYLERLLFARFSLSSLS